MMAAVTTQALALTGSSDSRCSTNTSQHVYTGTVPSISGISAVKTDISYDPANVVICSGDNFYTTGIAQSNSSDCMLGGAAQIGWMADTSGAAHIFSYAQYKEPSGQQCALGPYLSSSVTQSLTYTIEMVDGAVDGCGIGSYGAEFYTSLQSLYFDIECVNWDTAADIQLYTEKYGSQSRIGNVGYWWTQYCTGYSQYGCTPSTYLGSVTNLTSDPNGYLNPTGTAYTHFDACDKRDYPQGSGTC